RTHGLARPAPQAEVDVPRQLLGEGQAAALPLRHQVDPPARGLGLQAGHAEGRAVVQAEPAVDAGREVVVRRRVRALEGRRVLDVQAHTTYLPGESVRLGSNASRSW